MESKQLPMEHTDNSPAAFDYSVLDNDTADKLTAIAADIMSYKKEFIFKTAEKVKEAHDLLANHKNGLFGAWCESVGISRFTGNNLLNIVELFNNIPESEFENINKLKPYLIYEIAKPSAPKELVEQVMNGDITTHKDYIELKKQLEKSNSKLYAEAAKAEELQERNNDLELQIKELESRPVEVAEMPQEEIDLRVKAKTKELEERIEKLKKDNEMMENAIFGGNPSSGFSEEQIIETYEIFHDKARSALKDCVSFITSESLDSNIREKLTYKFRQFSDLLELYFSDLDETEWR